MNHDMAPTPAHIRQSVVRSIGLLAEVVCYRSPACGIGDIRKVIAALRSVEAALSQIDPDEAALYDDNGNLRDYDPQTGVPLHHRAPQYAHPLHPSRRAAQATD